MKLEVMVLLQLNSAKQSGKWVGPRACLKYAVGVTKMLGKPETGRGTLKAGSQYDALHRVIHLKPVQNRSQLMHDDAYPFEQRLNKNLFYSCEHVATRHSMNPP